MILQALGHLLPLAVAVAISSVPITATLLILLSSNQRRSSVSFLIGWILGIAALALFFTLAARAVPVQSARQPQLVLGIVQILIGLALLVLAVVMWRRASASPSQSGPRWLQSVSHLGPWSAFGVALALNLRPKAVLLSIAAGLAMTNQPLTLTDSAIALAFYTAIGASTVGTLVIYSLVQPERAEPNLQTVKSWIIKNNRIVTILILVMVGVVVIGNGLTRL